MRQINSILTQGHQHARYIILLLIFAAIGAEYNNEFITNNWDQILVAFIAVIIAIYFMQKSSKKTIKPQEIIEPRHLDHVETEELEPVVPKKSDIDHVVTEEHIEPKTLDIDHVESKELEHVEAKKLWHDKQTQTGSSRINVNGSNAEIHGIVIGSIKNKYYIQLRNKQYLLVNSKIVIPQQFVLKISFMSKIEDNDTTKNVATKVKIRGIIVREFIDKYQILLKDNDSKVTTSNIIIAKNLVIVSQGVDGLDANKDDVIDDEKDKDNVYEVDDDDNIDIDQDIEINLKCPLYEPNDFRSIRMSFDKNVNYDIKCIQIDNSENVYLYPYLTDFTMIQSVYFPNIVYFFSIYDHQNYKYNTITKEWTELAQENLVPLKEKINCFYLDYKKGLIGILSDTTSSYVCDEECDHKIRVYDELKDEWDIINEMKYLDTTTGESRTFKGCINCMVLDTKRMIYHLFDIHRDQGHHYTYNANTFELLLIDKGQTDDHKKMSKIFYSEYSDSFYVVTDWSNRHDFDILYEYDIKNTKWIKHQCIFSNFEIDNKGYKYFDFVVLNNLNKLIIFGGTLGYVQYTESRYVFELDLNTKCYTLLNRKLSVPFDIGGCFVDPFVDSDGYYKVNIFDKNWKWDSECNHAFLYIKEVQDDEKYNDDDKYAPFTEIKVSYKYISYHEEKEKKKDEEREEKNDEEREEKQQKEDDECKYDDLLATDFKSEGIEIAEGYTYDIKSVEISDELTFHGQSKNIVHSAAYPDIYYFFSNYLGESNTFKYNITTKEWKLMPAIDEEYRGSEYSLTALNAFYLNPSKGVIGITGNDDEIESIDTKLQRTVRIYNEFTNEWSVQLLSEQNLNLLPDEKDKFKRKHFEIGKSAIALDSKNNVYHLINNKNHITYNVHTMEWKEQCSLPHSFSADNYACFVYSKHTEMLYYVGGYSKMNTLWCYDTKIEEWQKETLIYENFIPSHEMYDHFGVVQLNGLNKLLIFGGCFFQKTCNFIFELDLKHKRWRLLDPNKYRLPKKIEISHCIPTLIDEENGIYKIDIFNYKKSSRKKERMTMYIDTKCKINSKEEENLKYYPFQYKIKNRSGSGEIKLKKKENNKTISNEEEEEKKEIFIHPFNKKAGIVVVGYIRSIWNISQDIDNIDTNIFKTLSLYFCFGFVDFSGIWKLKEEQNKKELYQYDEFKDEDFEYLSTLAIQFVGDTHSIKHDIYNNHININNHFHINNYNGGSSWGSKEIDQNIMYYDDTQFNSIDIANGYIQIKWNENKTKLITNLKKSNKIYTIIQYIDDNKYYLKVSNGENEILREYHQTDKVPDNGCLIM